MDLTFAKERVQRAEDIASEESRKWKIKDIEKKIVQANNLIDNLCKQIISANANLDRLTLLKEQVENEQFVYQ